MRMHTRGHQTMVTEITLTYVLLNMHMPCPPL